jgi:nitrite reductase/ring-hydroxylating ferredoxin subunit
MDWVKIFDSSTEAHARLVNDKPQLLLVRNKRICLIDRKEGLFAVDDACTHNGESLSKGAVNYLGEVVCPWHGYRFQVKTGREGSERSSDLVTYPIKEDANGVFIGL